MRFLLLSGFLFLAACATSTVAVDDGESSSSATFAGSSSSSWSGGTSNAAECEGTPGSAWDGTTAKSFACGTGTRANPYVILTAEQLAYLSFVTGAQDGDYTGKYFKLGADILLSGETLVGEGGGLLADSSGLEKWTPIGNSNVAFTGNFDGDGHSVSGVFIRTTSSHNGLFGSVSGIVRNFTVKDSWVMGGKYTAGAVGLLRGDGTVRRVENEASVTGTEAVGGIVGGTYHSYGTTAVIDSVENRGVVSGTKLVAGIVGSADHVKIREAVNRGEVSGNYGVGGIAGHTGYESAVERVRNFADIDGKEYTAGVLSFLVNVPYTVCYSNGKSYGSLKRAENFGKVSGTKYAAGVVGQAMCATVELSGNRGEVSWSDYVAGVVGHSRHSTSENLYNRGSVFGETFVGGIIGYNQEGVTSKAWTAAEVKGDSLAGVVIGSNYNTTMADYYYLGGEGLEAFGANNGGGSATAKSSAEMRSAEFADLLGEAWSYDGESNGGFPFLAE